jgi:SpoIID/LytB domain protein
MKTLFLLFLSLFTLSFANHPYKKVKVLLAKDQEGALIETRGPCYLFDLKKEKNIKSMPQQKRYYLRLDSDGLYWGEKFFNVTNMAFIPNDEKSSVLVNGVQYKGAVLVFGFQDNLTLINVLDIEDYLTSILSDKQKSPLEFEAMCALAIALRTNVLHSIFEHVQDSYHVDAKESEYKGYAITHQKIDIEEAILKTKSLVMQSTKGDFSYGFATDICENCAGKTVPYHIIYRKEAKHDSLRVESVYAKKMRQQFKWVAQLPLITLKKSAGFDHISKVQPFIDPNSQKVYGMRVICGNEHKDFDFIALQKIFGKETLQSSDFIITQVGDESLQVTGFGRGTGVGLCVFSANEMAKLGSKANDILLHFFPNIRIEKIDRIKPDAGQEQSELHIED